MKKNGFTLVELSVVLVVIGLIVTGVTSGIAVVKSARIKNHISQIKGFTMMSYTFFDTYDYLPGDLPIATQYWPTCPDDAASECNGNGNGKIRYFNSTYSENPTVSYEGMRAFQHLSFADLYKGNMSILETEAELKTGLPVEPIYGVGIIKFGNEDSLSGILRNYITVGSERDSATNLDGSALDSVTASNIDTKIDDGKPSSGKVRAVAGKVGAVAGSGCLSGSNYDLSNNENITCRVFYLIE